MDDSSTRDAAPRPMPWILLAAACWGTFVVTGSGVVRSPFLLEMSRDLEGAAVDPTLGDGLYYGPSRGHVQAKYAQLIGLPRGYGYGASMGAWILDYLGNWVAEWGDVVHSKMSSHSPAMTGDLTKLDGKVMEIQYGDPSGQPVSKIHVVMTNPGLRTSAEAQEGMAAFLEKRKPKWSAAET